MDRRQLYRSGLDGRWSAGGIYRLRNWARWCAMVLMVVGIAGSVPAVSAAARDLTWRFFWFGAQVMARVVIAWYLVASPEVLDAFAQKANRSNLP